MVVVCGGGVDVTSGVDVVDVGGAWVVVVVGGGEGDVVVSLTVVVVAVVVGGTVVVVVVGGGVEVGEVGSVKKIELGTDHQKIMIDTCDAFYSLKKKNTNLKMD